MASQPRIVWIVIVDTDDGYSDDIEGVFTTREAAVLFIESNPLLMKHQFGYRLVDYPLHP